MKRIAAALAGAGIIIVALSFANGTKLPLVEPVSDGYRLADRITVTDGFYQFCTGILVQRDEKGYGAILRCYVQGKPVQVEALLQPGEIEKK